MDFHLAPLRLGNKPRDHNWKKAYAKKRHCRFSHPPWGDSVDVVKAKPTFQSSFTVPLERGFGARENGLVSGFGPLTYVFYHLWSRGLVGGLPEVKAVAVPKGRHCSLQDALFALNFGETP